MQLHVTPEDATEWQMLLKGLHLPEDGRLHKIDAKCMHQGPPPEGYGQDMHRNRAVLHDAAFKRSLTTIFGDAGPGSTGVLVQGDLVLICDGRVSRNHQTINREVTKVIKNEKKEGQGQMRLRKYEPVSHLRFLYHNREFEGRRMSRSCSGTSKGANPEPLENVSVIWTKDVTLELRERKFVDLPGNNKARGWASQALKGDEDYMVSLLPRDCLWLTVLKLPSLHIRTVRSLAQKRRRLQRSQSYPFILGKELRSRLARSSIASCPRRRRSSSLLGF